MPPMFENMPREEQISENVHNDSVVYEARGRDDDKKVSYCLKYKHVVNIYYHRFCHLNRISWLK